MKIVKPKTKLQEKVLTFCNSIRTLYNLEPRDGFVKGLTRSGDQDPITRTIGLEDLVLSIKYIALFEKKDAELISSICKKGYSEDQDECGTWIVPVPKYVTQFTEMFEADSFNYRCFVDTSKEKLDAKGKTRCQTKS